MTKYYTVIAGGYKRAGYTRKSDAVACLKRYRAEGVEAKIELLTRKIVVEWTTTELSL